MKLLDSTCHAGPGPPSASELPALGPAGDVTFARRASPVTPDPSGPGAHQLGLDPHRLGARGLATLLLGQPSLVLELGGGHDGLGRPTWSDLGPSTWPCC